MVNICKKLSNPLIVIFKGMVLPYFWEINVLYVIHYEYTQETQWNINLQDSQYFMVHHQCTRGQCINEKCSYLVKGFIFNGDLSLSMCQFLGLWWNTALLLIWCFGSRLSRFIKTSTLEAIHKNIWRWKQVYQYQEH